MVFFSLTGGSQFAGAGWIFTAEGISKVCPMLKTVRRVMPFFFSISGIRLSAILAESPNLFVRIVMRVSAQAFT